MPNESGGYPLQIIKGGVDYQKFICIKCKLILRNPYQGYCGHRYCRDCLSALKDSGLKTCPYCEEEGICDEESLIEPDKTFPDNAIRREMGALQVSCIAGGCSWEGRYRDLEAHLSQCLYVPEVCSHCQNKVPRNKMQEHLASKCGTIDLEAFKCPFGCQDLILDQHGLDAHEHENQLHHLRIVLNKVQQMPNSKGFKSSKGDLQASGWGSSESFEFSRIQNLEGAVVVLSKDLSSICDKLAEIERQQCKIDQELKKAQNLERSILKLEARVSEVQTVITNLEKCTFDGLMIWKIENFSNQRESAINGQVTSIYSPPFYTWKAGYKICSRVYLNGDGMGKGTHMSLFFVIMRGPYDAILTWPFDIPVKFELMDVTGGKDSVIDIFRPDPVSTSFKKPTSSMNIASGCPMFISLTDFEQKRHKFVKDDAIFIKIEVNHGLVCSSK